MMDSIDATGLYIHVPFCVRKCAYCDFYSLAMGEGQVPPRYVDALIKEIVMSAELYGRPDVGTIYIGGGTPSLLRSDDLVRIIRTIRDNFTMTNDVEVTAEVNPGTIDEAKLTSFHQAGINRLSIGIQSSQEDLLGLLGRIHTWDEAEATVHSARRVGFHNISADLIYGIPTQTADDWHDTLSCVIALNPQHISCYELTLEPGTPMHDRYIDLTNLSAMPDEPTLLSMQNITTELLKQAGILRYEISNYATPGYESRHNMGYWRRRPYVGFGPAAHSQWGNQRLANPSDYNTWASAIESGNPARFATEELSRDDTAFEMMMLGLRTLDGIPLNKFSEEFGVTVFQKWGSTLEEMRRAGWMQWDSARIWLTPLGLDVHNVVCERLMTN